MERLTAGQIANSRQQTVKRKVVQNLCYLLFAFCCLLCRTCIAESPQDLFKKGNAAYAQGQFADAITSYEAARQSGLNHWVLDYNLGNAYYKSGQLGQAIVNYFRAFRLNSGQGDLIDNLQMATTKSGEPVLPSSGLTALCWRFFYFFSLNLLTLAVSLLFITVCVWTTLALVGKAAFRPDFLALLCAALAALGLWLGARIYLNERPEGIVVTSVADVRSGPNMSYPANFTIPEGRRVLLLDAQEPVTGWLEIGVPDQGLKGWVPTTSVEVI